jgi:DNA modification methylase
MKQVFLDDRITLYGGDNRVVLQGIPESAIDAVVTDPPYAMVAPRSGGNKGDKSARDSYLHASGGIKGHAWDTGEISFSPDFWAQCLRVLKPGGHLFAFGAPRTYHRLVSAIEDSGFEIRNMIPWLYGSGLPKGINVGAAIDKLRLPIPNPWHDWNTTLKPGYEPICMARKPLSETTVAANVLRWGTGAINIGGCRVGSEGGAGVVTARTTNKIPSRTGWRSTVSVRDDTIRGRYPSNIIHDGSEEILSAFPNPDMAGFYYCTKASAAERLSSRHPTVKPIALMEWLCTLITPPGGTILDPFAGTGTTGEAAARLGFDCVMIERDERYQADVAERMARLEHANDNSPAMNEAVAA